MLVKVEHGSSACAFGLKTELKAEVNAELKAEEAAAAAWTVKAEPQCTFSCAGSTASVVTVPRVRLTHRTGCTRLEAVITDASAILEKNSANMQPSLHNIFNVLSTAEARCVGLQC